MNSFTTEYKNHKETPLTPWFYLKIVEISVINYTFFVNQQNI